MPRSNTRLLAGLIHLVIGAAGFAYGLITYNNQKSSITSGLQRLFTGSSADERTATIFMIAGGAVALIGLLFLVFRSRRR